MAILETGGLKKQYLLGEHAVDALSGIDLRVETGEFLAIMGPSGSGKSTLLHLLGGLDRPTQGEITLAGTRLSVLNENQATLARRKNIGFVFQSFNLLPTLSAEENILLPLVIAGHDPAQFRQQVDKLLEIVSLSDRRHHRPDQLSGGEQQRVAIARALITRPAIVLADEPTGNLDSRTGSVIMDLLRRSRDELEQTIIMVTHDPRAAAYADRVVLLRDGRVEREIAFEPGLDREQRRRLVMQVMEQEN